MVTVRGPTDDVEKAVKLLKEMSEEKQLSGVTAPPAGLQHNYLQVPEKQRKGGSTPANKIPNL